MVSIAIHALSVALGGRQVLDGIDARLDPGQLVGVIGPNGAGKSTLARALLGLVPVSAGGVTIDGDPVAALPPRLRARRIAYLPQGQTLEWPLSVERLVALGRLPHLAPLSRIGTADMAAVERAMVAADIMALRARNAAELSGGERARALLARTLAVEAPALVVDEPLAALDPGHQLQVMALLRAQAAAGGLVIAVLHDLVLAQLHCDRLLLLDGGRLVADGPPGAVLTQARLRDVYGVGGAPATIDGRAVMVPVQSL